MSTVNASPGVFPPVADKENLRFENVSEKQALKHNGTPRKAPHVNQGTGTPVIARPSPVVLGADVGTPNLQNLFATPVRQMPLSNKKTPISVFHDDLVDESSSPKALFDSESPAQSADISPMKQKLVEEVTNLKSQLSSAQDRIGKLRKSLDDKDAALTNKEEDLAEYKKEYTRIQQEGRSLYLTYMAKCNRLKELTSAADSLKTEIAQREKQISDLEQNLQVSVQDVDEWKSKCRETNERFKENMNVLQTLRTELHEVRSKHESRTNVASVACSPVRHADFSDDSSTNALDGVRTILRQCGEDVDGEEGLDALLEKLQNVCQSIMAMRSTQAERIQALQSQLNAATMKQALQSEESSSASETAAALQSEIDELRLQAAEASVKYQAINESYENLKREHNEKAPEDETTVVGMTGRYAELSAENAALNDKIQSLVELVSYFEQVQNVESDFDGIVDAQAAAQSSNQVAIDAANAALTQEQQKCAALEASLEQAKSQISVAKKEIVSLQESLSEVQVVYKELVDRDNKIRDLQQNVDSLTRYTDDLQEQVEFQNDEIMVLKEVDTENSSLRTASTAQSERIHSLEDRCVSAQIESFVGNILYSVCSNQMTVLSTQLETTKAHGNEEAQLCSQEVDTFKSTVSSLEETVATLTADLASSEAEKARYMEESASSAKRIEELEDKLGSALQSAEDATKAHDEELAALKAEHEDVVAKLENTVRELSSKNEAVLSDLESKTSSTSATIDELRSQVETLTAQKAELTAEMESKVAALKSEFSEKEESMRTEMGEQTKQMQQVSGECTALKERLDELTSSKAKSDVCARQLQSQLDEAFTSLFAAQEQLATVTAQKDQTESQLTSKARQLEADLERSVGELRNAEKIIVSLREESTLQEEILKDEMHSKDAEIQALTEQVERQLGEASDQQLKIESLESEMEMLREELSDAHQQMNSALKNVDSLKASCATAELDRQELTDTKARIAELSQRVESREGQVRRMTMEMRVIESEKKQLLSQIEMLSKGGDGDANVDSAEASEEVSQLKSQLATYKEKAVKKINVLKSNVQSAEKEVKSLDRMLNHVRDVLSKHSDTTASVPDLAKLLKVLSSE